MKQFMKYWRILLVFVFSLVSNLCMSQMASVPAAAPAMWQAGFTQPNLSVEEVGAFEKRAEEKVKDFYNYLNIISDSKYDHKLREKAEKQAIELFVDSNCTIGKTVVKVFLDSCLSIKGNITWQVGNVAVKSALTRNGEVYTGTLSASVIKGSVNKDKTVAIVLSRKAKQFGGDSEMVWTVSLSNIE